MEEGFDVNKTPMFKRANYDYWKEMMIAFFESAHIDMWDVVEKDNHILLDDQKNEILRDKWMDDHKSKFLLNSRARNTMLCALSQYEYSKVKCNKLSFLTHKYELFSMEEGEDIQTMFGRFQTILNKLRSLGRHYDNYDHFDKILQSLSRKRRTQVTTLRAIKNLDSMTLEELFGILKFHKQELAQDEGTKKRKSLALTVQ
ncbi:hypothetical protein GmHk_07G019040 [Glycine max]|nr:hypothetical protein GmHk_07G019040 [Glycine max]